MKTQHTPGPWKVNEHSEVTFKDGRICDVDYYNVGRGEKGRYQLPHEANARLIAAAPELLTIVAIAIVYTRQKFAELNRLLSQLNTQIKNMERFTRNLENDFVLLETKVETVDEEVRELQQKQLNSGANDDLINIERE